MADRLLLVAGVGAAALGAVTAAIYYIGYNNGLKARGASGLRRLKTYENPNDPLASYLLEHNVEDPILSRLRDFTLTLPRGHMMSPVEENNLLTILCKAIGARKVIDVGVFTGCSAYAMALGLPAGGKVVACDVNWNNVIQGQPYWKEGGVADKIDLRINFATETLQELIDNKEEGTYDMIFIDADKQNYPNYYRLGLKLLRQGGLIVVDNALFTSAGNVLEGRFTNDEMEGIRTLNRMMRDDERIDYALLDIAEGIGIGIKN